jgi:hypothetical protein
MLRSLFILICTVTAGGCITVKLEPTKPIEVHAVVDVNVKSVDRKLDDFFGDLDKKSATIADPAAKP